MMRVLVVDDESPARDKLRRWLAEQPNDQERLLRTLERVRDRLPNKALHAKAIQVARQQ